MDPQDRVDWVYNSQTNAELAERYAAWATSYEQDLADHFDYNAHLHVAREFMEYVTAEAHILDAGSGTGLVGQLLHTKGYQNIVAMDLSAAMLAEAAKKNVYTDLKVGILGQPLDFPTAHFDAIVSAGVFTTGHAPASSFDELLRITKADGYLVFTLNDLLNVEGGEFLEKFAALEREGKWQHVQTGPSFQPTPVGEPEVTLRVWVFRKHS